MVKEMNYLGCERKAAGFYYRLLGKKNGLVPNRLGKVCINPLKDLQCRSL